MQNYVWSRLNNLQVGKYTEYFVKMELTMYGFEVYTTEVDDRGIDFVARRDGGPFIEVQVKSLRDSGYVFMQKTKFELRDSLYLAFGLLVDGKSFLLASGTTQPASLSAGTTWDCRAAPSGDSTCPARTCRPSSRTALR